MSDAVWSAPADLLAETRAIILVLQRRWPNKLGYLLERTEVAKRDLNDIAFGLHDIDRRVLPQLAREYLIGHEFPPGPHELRVEALRVQARDYPQAAPPPEPPPPVDLGRDDARVERITKHLRKELGSYQLAMAAWDHMGAAAADPAAFLAVKAGKVGREAIAAAIAAVRASHGHATGVR